MILDPYAKALKEGAILGRVCNMPATGRVGTLCIVTPNSKPLVAFCRNRAGAGRLHSVTERRHEHESVICKSPPPMPSRCTPLGRGNTCGQIAKNAYIPLPLPSRSPPPSTRGGRAERQYLKLSALTSELF